MLDRIHDLSASLCPALALLVFGAGAACSASAPQPPSMPPPFDAARAWNDLVTVVGFGPRPVGSETLERTFAYIEGELREAGLSPQREPFRATTPLGEFDMRNVYADLEGQPRDGEPAPVVILAGHVDTKLYDFEFVGANDGGSSTAVMLELARALAASGPHPLTYRFLFLDGEEATRPTWFGEDNTYGSRHHAQQLLQGDLYDRVRALVLVDLVGDRDLKLTRDTNSDADLSRLFFESARELGLGKHVGGRSVAVKDDHLAFLAVGIPSVDLIDLDYGPGNSWWHSREDTLDKVSQDSLGIVGRIVLAGLERLESQASGAR